MIETAVGCDKCTNGFIVKGNNSYPCECFLKRENERIWRESGIPYTYWDLDISMIDLRRGEKEYRTINKETVTIIKNFKSKFKECLKNNDSLYILGSHGNGKTLCACDVAKYVALQKKNSSERYKVIFITFQELISITLNSFSHGPLFKNISDPFLQKEKLFKLWTSADLRVVDDIGKEPITRSGSESSILDQFVRSSLYDEQKSMILTSNVHTNEVRDRYNHNIDSLLSRKILHVELKGDDYQKDKSNDIRTRLLA